MRTKEEAMKLVNELKEQGIISVYKDRPSIRGYNFILCWIYAYYPNIVSEVEELIKGKKTIEMNTDNELNLRIKIYYTDDEEERKKRELKDGLKELLDKEY